MTEKDHVVPVAEWHSLLASGRNELLSTEFISWIQRFIDKDHLTISRKLRCEINRFVKVFLDLFCDRRFKVPPDDAPRYLSQNAVIAFLAACSDFVNTDSWLRMLDKDQAPPIKILILYSLRNRHRVSLVDIFQKMPEVASHWYALQMSSAKPPAQRWLMENARALYADMPDGYMVISPATVLAGYFAITYLDPENERPYKQKLNTAIQRVCKDVRWNGPRNPRSLAIITRRWFPESAVYRALYPYLQALSNDYKLTLVHLGDRLFPTTDKSLFTEVRVFPALRNVSTLSGEQRAAILDQDWALAFFPDIGMNVESIYLGNCRLAPIQAMGYGHPASMHGGQIDYFIAGEDSELPELSQEYFSERLVMLPGLGMIPIWPTEAVCKLQRQDRDVVLVNCPWTLFKMNADIIDLLREIIVECRIPMRFRFFAGLDQSDQGVKSVYRQDLAELLGERYVELLGLMDYKEFLSEMAVGDVTIVPYPFGGFNTVIDSLYVGVPTVTREGVHGYNRFPAALLRKVGMGNLIAYGREEFKAKIVQLITDVDYRRRVAADIGRIDMEKKFSADLDPYVFNRMIDYLLSNHESLCKQNSRTPILIK